MGIRFVVLMVVLWVGSVFAEELDIEKVFESHPLAAGWKEMYDEIDGANLDQKSLNAMTTWEMKAVSFVSFWQCETQMLDTAHKLFETLDAEGQVCFLKAHEAWKKYVDADALFLTDPSRDGSVRGIYFLGVKKELTLRRTKLYREMLSGKNIFKDELFY